VSPAELYAALPENLRQRRELLPLGYAAGDPSLRAAYVHNLARNLALFHAAAQFLDAATVPLLPLKGLALANTVYPDVALRPMNDLDIAVRPRDLDQAVRTLEELGWRRSFGERARYSPKHGHDVSFVNENGHVLELHHRLFHELRADASVVRMFERAIAVELLGRSRLIPSWNDHLFLVAVHAATHAFGESPIWVVDVALLLEHASAGHAEDEAVRRGAGYAFRAALRTAHRVFSHIPAPVGEMARETLLDWILRDRLAAPGWIQSLLARAVLTEKPSDALREIGRKLGLRAVELRERSR
jgi:hypothetical protein